MTKTTCDICGRELPNGLDRYAFEGQATFLLHDPTGPRAVEIRSFEFELKVKTFQFNCTNFDVCLDCIKAAVVNSPSLKPA